jgi:hypothetical protein
MLSSIATTSAERGSPVSSAISPKQSPGPSRLREMPVGPIPRNAPGLYYVQAIPGFPALAHNRPRRNMHFGELPPECNLDESQGGIYMAGRLGSEFWLTGESTAAR